MARHSRRGSVLREIFGNHSDLGVIVALAGVALLAALGYAVFRSTSSDTVVKTDRPTTSLAIPLPRRVVARSTTVPSTVAVPSTTRSTLPPVTIRPTTRVGSSGGGKGGRTPSGARTNVAVGPATNVRWAAAPATANLAPGGHLTGRVTVKNLSSEPGYVISPGCSSGPRPMAKPTALAARKCAPAGRQVIVPAGRSRSWEWAWSATSDGSSTGVPLPPGNYSFTIGGATVTVVVA